MLKQRSLQVPVSACGVGLHSGRDIVMWLRPAAAGSGITFIRTDLAEPVRIGARVENVVETSMGTVLARGPVKVSTVEHLLSALAGLGIDNLDIELTGPEVPIMDGSAAQFVALIESAGVVQQPAAKRLLRVKKAVQVEDDDKWARFDPYEGFRVNFEIAFDHPVLRSAVQRASLEFSTASYLDQVSCARTFGFLRDLEYLRSRNLALGGSLDNAIVLDDERILNEGGLRLADEFVKHKMLDAIGDLYLAGQGLIGEFTGYKSGHGLNNRLVRALLADESAWEVVSFDNVAAAPISYQSSNAIVQ